VLSHRMFWRPLIVVVVSAVLTSPVAAQTVKLKIVSTLKEIFDNLPLYVAIDGGHYKKHGLDVELTHFSGGGEVVRAISGGAADIGMVGTSAAIIAASRGEPLRIISAWSAPAYGVLFVVPADSPIKRVEDMAGKKIGFSRPGSVSHTGMLVALRAKGIKADGIPVGSAGDGWAMLKAGRIDVTWHNAPDVYSLTDRKEARVLFETSEFLNEYQQGSLAALESTATKSADVIGRFLSAISEVNALIESNPVEATKLGATGMGLPAARLQEMVQAMPKGFFRLGPPTEANFAGSMVEAMASGGLKQQPTYDKVVDTRFFPAKK
jgi:ABC-type nitrate/sulfonate/bicarbonate transport system substrate-binding protein